MNIKSGNQSRSGYFLVASLCGSGIFLLFYFFAGFFFGFLFFGLLCFFFSGFFPFFHFFQGFIFCSFFLGFLFIFFFPFLAFFLGFGNGFVFVLLFVATLLPVSFAPPVTCSSITIFFAAGWFFCRSVVRSYSTRFALCSRTRGSRFYKGAAVFQFGTRGSRLLASRSGIAGFIGFYNSRQFAWQTVTGGGLNDTWFFFGYNSSVGRSGCTTGGFNGSCIAICFCFQFFKILGDIFFFSIDFSGNGQFVFEFIRTNRFYQVNGNVFVFGTIKNKLCLFANTIQIFPLNSS